MQDQEGSSGQDVVRVIYAKMIDYLSRADMSERRLIDRVIRLQKRYPQSERYRLFTKEKAREAVQLLKVSGYVDEERYARRLVEGLSNRYDGPRVIRAKMLQRGIQPQIVDAVLTDHEQVKRDLIRIIKRARSKYRELELKSQGRGRGLRQSARQRLYAWLVMRGFGAEDIRLVVDSVVNRSVDDAHRQEYD